MKKSAGYLIAVLLCIFCFFPTSCMSLSYEQEIKSVLPGIVCWGDSLTAGTGGFGTNYPSVLKKNIQKNICKGIDVVNLGVGGESSETICARAGVYNPLALSRDVVIPEERKKTEIFLNYPVLQQRRGGSVNPCYIGGIEGKITVEQESFMSKEYRYYFCRSERGESAAFSAGTTIETSASSQYKDYISVIFMGQNGGWNNDPQTLIAQQRALLERQTKNADKFLILGLTSGDAESRRELEESMAAEYGDKYVNLREYLSGEGVKAQNLTPSAEDEEQMARGEVPACLRSDGVHFNAKGYRAIGNYVYERMDELGYFDEVKGIIKDL